MPDGDSVGLGSGTGLGEVFNAIGVGVGRGTVARTVPGPGDALPGAEDDTEA